MTHDKTTFGVGPNYHCAHSPGLSGGVEFHNPTGTYSRGGAIAIACQTYTTQKCSRSVTFMGRTFTANKGYPRCGDEDTEALRVVGYSGRTPQQQGSSYTPKRTESRGIFRVRIWGKVCHAARVGVNRCWDLKNPTPPPGFDTVVNAAGYGATFGTARHCGPPSWPTPQLQMAGAPAYAKYCDVTVDRRFP